MSKKLEVKDLRISFRTLAGKVQAVRDVSFDLEKGETLAIVGESGSGKSVTSKAVIGILSGNALVEGGEILYDGKDLLRISEDEFYKIRGDKIAMIFQDPLSSLNPIMRIGKQLTEAMILKGKARQKSSRDAFNSYMKLLREYMVLAGEDPQQVKEKCDKFDKFEYCHIDLERAYNDAYEAATEASSDIENALFLIEKKAFKDPARTMKDLMRLCEKTISTYVVNGADADALNASVKLIRTNCNLMIKSGDYSVATAELGKIKDILTAAIAKPMPNFFAMGYYNTFADKPLPELEVDELNKYLRRYLDDNFMLDFIASVNKALRYSAQRYNKEKQDVIDTFKQTASVFDSPEISNANVKQAADLCIKEVKESIDPLDINKDSMAYTFSTVIDNAVSIYLGAPDKNEREKKRFDRQTKKYESIVAKGKTPDWAVVPASYVDIDLARQNIKRLIERLYNHYAEVLENAPSRDFDQASVDIIDYLKENAANSVRYVSKQMAKHRALKLMEEVGIPEPRKRYMQYPFEFSGGMRQRIVIAIALSADPDILICDEPTTALDVTIQAQILELINKIKAQRNLSIIFITHDLGVVANMADKIAVMYAGKIVEYGTADDIFYRPAHPYTWALLSSMPDLDTNEKLEAIPGTPPNMIYPPKGDAFAERNKYAMQIDFEAQPPMFKISDTHSAATWLLHPDAPKVEMPKIVSERIKKMKKVGGAGNE